MDCCNAFPKKAPLSICVHNKAQIWRSLCMSSVKLACVVCSIFFLFWLDLSVIFLYLLLLSLVHLLKHFEMDLPSPPATPREHTTQKLSKVVTESAQTAPPFPDARSNKSDRLRESSKSNPMSLK